MRDAAAERLKSDEVPRRRLRIRAGRALLGATALGASLITNEVRAADDKQPASAATACGDAESAAPTKPVGERPKTEQNEFAGAPILGGNTDIGFQIGLAATFTRVSPRFLPYAGRSTGSSRRASRAVHAGPRWSSRATTCVSTSRASWAGRSASCRASSSSARSTPATSASATHTGDHEPRRQLRESLPVHPSRDPRAREPADTALSARISIMYGLTMRNVSPTTYAGSKLDLDSRRIDEDGEPYLRGLEALNHAIVSVGLDLRHARQRDHAAQGQPSTSTRFASAARPPRAQASTTAAST